MKKTICALILVLFWGCSDSSQQVFNAEVARRAIANYINRNPDVFISPDLTETAYDIRNAETISRDKGKLHIGHFWVDLNNKIYSLGHHYGPNDANEFEHWQWNGMFLLDSNNQWILSEPDFTQSQSSGD